MRRLHLPPFHDNLPVLINKRLSNVQTILFILAKPQQHINLIFLGRRLNRPHLRGVDLQAVLDVLGAQFEVDGPRPDPRRVAGDPALRERDQLGVLRGRFGDQLAGFGHAGGQVEPFRFCLRDGDADGFGGWVGHFGGCLGWLEWDFWMGRQWLFEHEDPQLR